MSVKEYEGHPFNEVISEGLVVVQFYATWCGPCKMLKPVIESISKEMKDVNFFKIDIDAHRVQAIESGIRSVPTVVVYKDGEEVDRSIGYLPKDKMSSFIYQYK